MHSGQGRARQGGGTHTLPQEKWWVESCDSARQRSPRGMYSVTSMIWSPVREAPRNCTMLTWRSDFRMATSLRKRCCSFRRVPRHKLDCHRRVPLPHPLVHLRSTASVATQALHKEHPCRIPNSRPSKYPIEGTFGTVPAHKMSGTASRTCRCACVVPHIGIFLCILPVSRR